MEKQRITCEHSSMRGPELEPNSESPFWRQNQGSVSDRCPKRFSSVMSPDIFISSSVISWSVLRYSGLTGSIHNAFQVWLYICLCFRVLASNLWMLLQARRVVRWLLAFLTSAWKHKDFSPRARWRALSKSLIWPLWSSASTCTMSSSNRRSASPGANTEGSVIHSCSGVTQPSGCSLRKSSNVSPSWRSKAGSFSDWQDHSTSSSNLMIQAIHCS